MVNLYATLIIKKRRSFDSIADILKKDVEKRLLELGYDTNGDPIVDEAGDSDE